MQGHFASRGVDASDEEIYDVTRLLLSLGCGDSHTVSQVYSQPRVAPRAWECWLPQGFSLDLAVPQENGEPLDLSVDSNASKANALIDCEKPYLLIGSPPCTYGSKLQQWNFPKMNADDVEAQVKSGTMHLHNSIKLYKQQMHEGRRFLYEHPAGNLSWQDEKMLELMSTNGVYPAKSPRCRYGMASEDKLGSGLVRKRTWRLTNSYALSRELNNTCANPELPKERQHRHVYLVGGRAKASEVYPPKLVEAILRWIQQQMFYDGGLNDFEMASRSVIPPGPTCEEPLFEAKDEEEEQEYGDYIDDTQVGF